jgi:uncharacterized membrane protein YfcA
MPLVTPGLLAIIFSAGVLAGAFGALLGLGGGIFLVPFLNLVLGFPISAAAAISLTTVIATSSSVSAGRSAGGLINFRLGMALEVATAGGSVLGGLTAQMLSQSTLQRLFGMVAGVVAATMLTRVNRRNVIFDSSADAGLFGGRYYDSESGREVMYRVKRLPAAVAASFVAGNVSSLLGIGGGIIKVPVLIAWCGVPVRVAAATSAFMIGVTAIAGATIYYGRGQLVPPLAAAAVIGVQLGPFAGFRLGNYLPARGLKLLMAGVLLIVSVMMFVRGAQ